MKAAMTRLPGGSERLLPGTELQTEEREMRLFTEEMDVEQGNLVIGFRWHRSGPADYPALAVFNELYGGGDNSRLFLNIREDRALCYAVGSSVERYKEIMFVAAGIDFDKREEAQEAILAELGDLARGNISSVELETARRSVAAAYLQGLDNPASVCEFRLGQNLLGSGGDLRQYAALAAEVQAEDVARIASEMKPQLSYFLRGEAGT